MVKTASALVAQLEQHRSATNEKVTQLNVAHAAVRNGVVGLVIALVVLTCIVLLELT